MDDEQVQKFQTDLHLQLHAHFIQSNFHYMFIYFGYAFIIIYIFNTLEFSTLLDIKVPKGFIFLIPHLHCKGGTEALLKWNLGVFTQTV